LLKKEEYGMIIRYALVAQLDRVPGYEPGGQRFESSPVRFFMILERFPLGPADTNAYLLGCTETKRAAVIDAPFGGGEILPERAKELHLQIEMILLTHSHWDHTADAHALKEALQCPLFVHEADAGNVKRPGSDRLPLFFPIVGVNPDGFLVDGQVIQLGALHIEVIHTPGHTPGGVCFYLPSEKTVFSGDTLFKGTMGNISFPTSEPAAMWRSLQRLSKLPKDTKVYPGHGEATTIGEESWIARAKELMM
jgi:hydroxyacylglutathione hydrolase